MTRLLAARQKTSSALGKPIFSISAVSFQAISFTEGFSCALGRK